MADERHSLLRRQLRRHFGPEDDLPPEVAAFIDVVDGAYKEFDADRGMIERSLELSSQELLQANSDMGAVLEVLLDLFFHVDQDGVILAYRVGNTSDVFISPDQFIGKRIQNIPLPLVGAKFGEAIRRVHATKSLVRMEYTITRSDGDHYYDASLLPLRNGEIAVIIINITEKRRTEERERRLNDRLARAERMESLGVLAGGVAHDLNNILGPVLAYPSMIMPDLPDDSESREFVEEIEKSARRAVAVIQDLLTMARRGNYVLEPVDVNSIVNSYVSSFAFTELQAQHPRCILKLELEKNMPPALGIQHHLNQAVMNLIMNAYEAIPDHGHVTVTTEVAHVEEHAGMYDTIAKGTYILVRVSDTGDGIPQENMEHIFEPFYSRKKMGRSGSGLGLTVVYGVVRDMNGYVDVDSSSDGTRMRIYIPVSEKEIETSGSEPTDLSGNEQILVVDDVKEQRDVARHMLMHLGYKVATAEHGHAALAYLRENPADLVITDMIMEEGFDGLDTYMAIREINRRQKCIIASVYSETDRVREALSCGACAFDQKPYAMDAIGSIVRTVLDGAE